MMSKQEEIMLEMKALELEMNNEILDYYTILGGFKPAVYRFHDDSYSKNYKDINVAILSQLTSGRYKDLFEPAKFFDYLYIAMEQYRSFKHKQFQISSHIDQHNFTNKQRKFFERTLYNLISIIDEPGIKDISLIETKITTAPASEGLSLKSQFLDQNKYQEILNKLILNENIRESSNGKLEFLKCHRSGTKYGVEALRQVLDNMSLLKKQSGLTNSQILEIHQNTFKDFNADIKTINNKAGISKAFTYFKDVLS